MKRQTILILLGIAVILLLITFYPVIRDYINPALKNSGVPSPVDTSILLPSRIDKITISKNAEEKKVIKRTQKGWNVGEYPADKEEIKRFLNEIKTIKVDHIVSKNKENHALYQVDDRNGDRITLFEGGKQIFSFIAGKEAAGPRSLYIRVKDDDRVYQTISDIRWFLNFSVNDWRDKKIVKLTKDSIYKVEIDSPEAKLEFFRKDGKKWFFKEKEEAKRLKDTFIDDILEAVVGLKGAGFVEAKSDIKTFKKAKKTTYIKLFDASGGRLLSLKLVKHSDEWWAALEGGPYIYKVPTYRLNALLIKPSDIKMEDSKAKEEK